MNLRPRTKSGSSSSWLRGDFTLMPITYTIDRNKHLIRETWKGEIHAADLGAYWQGYLADAEVLKIRRTIADLREATICFSGLDFDSLIRTTVLPVLHGRTWTTAIVVGNSIQFGVSRQYQIFAERFSNDSIFKDVADAEAWLASRESPGTEQKKAGETD